MSANVVKRIRIIKRAASGEPRPSRRVEPTTAKEGGDAEKIEQREAAATVKRWVGELRQRKDREAAQAFESLFQKAA